MVKVVYIPCLFEDRRIEFESHNFKVASILERLVKKYPEIRNDSPCISIRVNGKKLPPAIWTKTVLKDGDRVTIIQEPGETILAIIGWIGVGVYSAAQGAAIVGGSAAGFAAVMTVATIIDIALVVASVAFSIYSAVASPDTPRTGYGLKNSPTYGWDSIAMQIRPGVPVPVVYGEHVVAGNLISCFVSTNGEKNYLNMLIALAEGEIEGLLKEDGTGACASTADTPLIYINDNLFSNFPGITWDYRLGTQDQTPINGFDDIKQVYNAGPFEIDFGVPYNYTTVDEDIEAYEIRIRLPGFYFTYHGNYYPRRAKLHFYHRVHGEGEYISDGTLTIEASTSNVVRRYFRKDGLAAAQYDIKVVRESVAPYTDPPEAVGPRDTIIDNVTEIKYDALLYPHTALLALKIRASERLSGQIPNVIPVIRGRKVKNLDTAVTEWTRNPIYNTNDVIVTERFGLGRFITQANMNNDQLIDQADHCDEKVGNGTKRTATSVTGTSLTDDAYGFVAGDVGKTICCKSPADATQYTRLVITSLTGSHQANGTAGWDDGTPTDLVWEFGEARFEMDLVLDAQEDALSLVRRMCATFRGTPIWAKDSIQIGVDRKESPSYSLTMGNILKGSFKHRFVQDKLKANCISMEYLDREARYKKLPIEVPDRETLAGGVPKRTRYLPMFGVTRRSQIYREGRFHLLAAKYQDEQIELGGGIDAIHSRPMDVVDISHDVPAWGCSGRIMAATINTITLDREVEVLEGFTYVVTVIQPGTGGTELLETRTVANGVGFYSTLSVTADFSAVPAAGGIWAFGKQGIEAKPFRFVSVLRTPQNTIQVAGSEYQDACYVDTDIILPEIQYSDLPTSMQCPHVQNLVVGESGAVLEDGTWAGFLEVGFQIPEVPYFLGWDHAEIWIGLKGDASLPADESVAYQHYGNTTKEVGYTVEGHNFLKVGNIVYVKVVLVTKTGLRADFDTAPYVAVTITGKTLTPSDVTGFSAAQMGDRIMLSWTPPEDRDIVYYEIRDGASWATAQIVGKNITEIPWTWLYFDVGVHNLMIKAVDRSGNYSTTPASAEITVTSVPTGSLLATMDGLKNPSAYSNTMRQVATGGGIYGKSVVVGLTPSQGWDDGGNWDDGSKWDVPVASATGYFETDAIDFGAVGKVNILVDADYVLEGGTQGATIEIKTSENGTDWTSYATFVAGQYYCRYARFKISLSTSDTDYNIFVTQFTVNGYQAGIVGVNFSNQTIDVGGTAITFGITFAAVPSVTVTPIGSTLLVAKVTSKTTTGCTVQLYDMSSTDVGGTADIIVQGQ